MWARLLELLSGQVRPAVFDSWLRPCRLLAVEGDDLRIGAPNRFSRDWLLQHHVAALQSAAEKCVGGHPRVSIVVDDGAATALDRPAAAPPPGPSGGTAERLNPRYTFDTFVVGSSNQFAQAACQAVAELPSRAYNPLFIYGGVGLGKTHLLHAVGHQCGRLFPGMAVAYFSSEHFTNELINAIRYDHTADFRARYRTMDLLLIDDIQFIAGKERTQEEFFHTFNDLYESRRQIILSSDSAPKNIPEIEERLRSRFEWGLIADIQPPDFETRLAILHSKLGDNGSLIPEEVLSFIAHKVQRNIRELEGALTRVQAFAAVHQRQVDEEEAARLLSDIIPASTRKPINVERIQVLVADYYNVTLEDMKGKRRDKHIVFPRQVAMYLVREETPSSLPAIGKAFGGRDHTTALHSIEKIANELKEDERLRYEVQAIREKLYVQ